MVTRSPGSDESERLLMAQPHVEQTERDADQLTHERAMAEVSDVLLNLVLDDVVGALDAARKRLQKDVYFSGDELRLI